MPWRVPLPQALRHVPALTLSLLDALGVRQLRQVRRAGSAAQSICALVVKAGSCLWTQLLHCARKAPGGAAQAQLSDLPASCSFLQTLVRE